MDHRVQKVIRLINQSPTREMRLSDMAESVNLSSSRLYQIFKTEVGVPPTRYLKLLKMKMAKELLENTFLSVKEIMSRVGASDESHFMRDFKREYRMTPTQYRTHHLNNTKA